MCICDILVYILVILRNLHILRYSLCIKYYAQFVGKRWVVLRGALAQR
jgi:hypothetical protein